MNNQDRKSPDPSHSHLTLKLTLFLFSLMLTFLVIEMYYRIFNPFPYFSKANINSTEHGNLSEYSPLLGWEGKPGGKAQFTTENNSVWLENNSMGFRDIEHDKSSKKLGIVFLGDSFTWGYEVEFDDMFVNLLRDKFRNYEIFNLSHRGYGTDQELLGFENWRYQGQIKLVVLMFAENDVENNNSDLEYEKPKPKFEEVGEKLVLTGVPIVKIPEWNEIHKPYVLNDNWKENIKEFLFKSQFLHAMYICYTDFKTMNNNHNNSELLRETQQDLTLTSGILKELKKTVESRGAKLIIFLIPSVKEIENLSNSPPYQRKIADLCKKLSITCFDLAPAFKETWRTPYYHYNGHWNAYGHKVAAEAIYNLLISNTDLNLRSVKANSTGGNN